MLGSPEPIQPPLQRLITPERRLEALQHVNRGLAGLSFLWDWAKIFTISVVLFFGIKTFLVEAFKIPSGSMERTLLDGDFLLVNKVVYGAELPLVSRRLPGLRRRTRGDGDDRLGRGLVARIEHRPRAAVVVQRHHRRGRGLRGASRTLARAPAREGHVVRVARSGDRRLHARGGDAQRHDHRLRALRAHVDRLDRGRGRDRGPELRSARRRQVGRRARGPPRR
jgi:hypothetical protein